MDTIHGHNSFSLGGHIIFSGPCTIRIANQPLIGTSLNSDFRCKVTLITSPSVPFCVHVAVTSASLGHIGSICLKSSEFADARSIVDISSAHWVEDVCRLTLRVEPNQFRFTEVYQFVPPGHVHHWSMGTMLGPERYDLEIMFACGQDQHVVEMEFLRPLYALMGEPAFHPGSAYN